MSATPEVKKRVSEASKVREWAVKEITDVNMRVNSHRGELLEEIQKLRGDLDSLRKVVLSFSEEAPDLECSEELSQSSSSEEEEVKPKKRKHEKVTSPEEPEKGWKKSGKGGFH